MSAMSKIEIVRPEAHFPPSLAEWLQTQPIDHLVSEATTEMVTEREEHPQGNTFVRNDAMLRLLVASYAKGIYSSEDIARTAAENAALEELTDIEIPEAQTVRRFRRTHRVEIEHCLSKVLGHAWEFKFGLGEETADLSQNRTANSPYIYEALFPFAAEAQSRLNRAVRYDCWTCDW